MADRPSSACKVRFAGSRSTVEQATGHRPPWVGRTFADLDADVRESMAILRSTPYLVSHDVRGMVYDVTTGVLREVHPTS